MRKRYLVILIVGAALICAVPVLAGFAYYAETHPPNYGAAYSWSDSNLEVNEVGTFFDVSLVATNGGPATLTQVSGSINGAFIGTCDEQILPAHYLPCQFSGRIPSCATLTGGLPYSLKLVATWNDGTSAETDLSVAPGGGSC